MTRAGAALALAAALSLAACGADDEAATEPPTRGPQPAQTAVPAEPAPVAPPTGQPQPAQEVAPGERATTAPDGTARAPLTIQRAERPDGGGELLVSLPDPGANSPRAVRGATVLLACRDARGRVRIRNRHDWPLAVEPGLPPHVHEPAPAKVIDSVRSCRLSAPGIDLRGRTGGPPPAA